MKVAIVGGTGKFGLAFAKRLHAAGIETLLGSRDSERARQAAAGLGVEGGSNDEVVRSADLVVLAVKSHAALDTARELAEAIGETPVLCVASDLRFTEYGVLPGRESNSLAEEVAQILDAPVASGFQSVSAVELNRSAAPDQDVLVCGDDPKTTELALELAGHVVAGRAIDAGPLANSRALEGMTAVMLNVNNRYRAHAGIRITGLP